MDTEKIVIENKFTLNIRSLFLIFACLGTILLLGYTFYTSHIWEDFFITFRCSKNLADGNGLVYSIGEHVHAFTSPLGVLLPALTYILTGKTSYLAAIWGFRIIFCIPAFLGSIYFIVKLLGDNKDRSKEILPLILLLYIFDVKSIMFTMNGMETGIMLFFLLSSIYFMHKGIEKHWIASGLLWGGLMWTRPDSCFYVAAIMIATFIFPSSQKDSSIKENNIVLNFFIMRKSQFFAIVKSAIVTTLIYLPWFLWAWWYYGSPVPNTVFAKSAISSFSFGDFFKHIFIYPTWAFMPVYPVLTKWPIFCSIIASILSIFSCCYFLIAPRVDLLGRKLSLIFLILSCYFATMPFPYPWYFPPLAVIGYIVTIRGLWFFTSYSPALRRVMYGLVFIIVINSIFIFIATTYQISMQQKLIETGLRMKIGEWIKDHKKSGDTVFLEPLGYIGYFSEADMLDYPGLATPKVTLLIKEKHCDYYSLIPELKPDWIVSRLFRDKYLINMPYIQKNYSYIGCFSAIKQIKESGYIPGRGYLEYDSAFVIYRKK